MDSKKLARVLQTAAKKFNYDIKLTHAQEIIAIMSGFENRHALFKSEEKAQPQKEVKIEVENGLSRKIMNDDEIIGENNLTKKQETAIEEMRLEDQYRGNFFDFASVLKEKFIKENLEKQSSQENNAVSEIDGMKMYPFEHFFTIAVPEAAQASF